MPDYVKRITAILDGLKKAEKIKPYHIPNWKCQTSSSGTDGDVFTELDTWGDHEHACFNTRFILPKEYEGNHVVVVLETGTTAGWNVDNPQFLVFADGKQICGLDVNHTEFDLPHHKESEIPYTLQLYAYVNHKRRDVFFSARAWILLDEVRALYFDINTALEAARLLPEQSLEQIELLKLLNNAVNLLDFRMPGTEMFLSSVSEAAAFLKQNLYHVKPAAQKVTEHCIGHTHIDVAWKWTLAQTREKAVRSFSTVIYLMEKYPGYRFMSSQPQLYQFVKEDCPELFDKIKEKVQAGVWEPEGSMWVEPDCNLTSGESLIRQLIYGKRFFREEFGVDNEVLWLPDVFGYSASMPQILKKAGVKYFMTTKISWNETNRIPNDTMMWRGIDGTEILTYFITTPNPSPDGALRPEGFFATYNGGTSPQYIMGAWERYQNKSINTEILTCFGHGDGGGGPTIEMLEMEQRLEYGLPGVPMTKQTFVKDFFKGLEARLETESIPRWVGELYLEFHRGTYTSMGRNKRYNRQCEFQNGSAEFLSLLNNWSQGAVYPEQELRHAWEITLLNQFHDILPGSSIKEVYEDSKVQYEKILTLTDDIIKNQKLLLSKAVQTKEESALVINTAGINRKTIAGFKTDQPVSVYKENHLLPGQMGEDGIYRFITELLPSKGYDTYQIRRECSPTAPCFVIRITGEWIDTPFYLIQIEKDGYFSSIYDKEEKRELVQKGKRANVLQVFEDRPLKYNAWNLDEFYTEKMWEITDVLSWNVTENGPIRACIEIQRRFLDSFINQTMIFYVHSKRIDFKTTIDWKQNQLFLKTAFPMDIMSDKAVFEIQYGNVERATHRNTSWDQARFEVCAHKWVDLAENGYGVALLNDCKYGYDILDSVMRLSLLKSGIDPNPDADQELHHMTYSLYPHQGDFREGNVIGEAYDLNCPAYVCCMEKNPHGILPPRLSFVESSLPNVVVETVKKAESGNEMIVRMYEAFGKRCRPVIRVASIFSVCVKECDLLEQECSEVLNKENCFELEMKPYEIKTLKLRRNSDDSFV